MNIAIEWRCTTYASHPFGFCLTNKEKKYFLKNSLTYYLLTHAFSSLNKPSCEERNNNNNNNDSIYIYI
jgi:hypothetical protein